MATATTDTERRLGPASDAVTNSRGGGIPIVRGTSLTSERIWHAVAGASFAVLSYVTPAGEPRSSGIVYRTAGPHLYAAVASDSWKARHIALHGEVSVTVPIRRGGGLSLVLPIPPATVSFHATAKVYPAGSPAAHSALKRLGPLLPPERRDSGSIIEITPEGAFLTYGVGVSLLQMRNPVAARARLPVSFAE